MWHTLNKNIVLHNLNTNEKTGLSDNEIKKRQAEYGINKLQDKSKESIIIKSIKQFNDFMIIILIIASILSAVMSYMQGENDYIDSIIIIGIVILNAIMGLVQEEKAEKSIESLKKLTPQTCKVLRNGTIEEINSEDLVPGDIITLESGDFVPADCRLLECQSFKVEESSLTGETEPVLKDANNIYEKDVPIGDMKNLVFMATTVVNGHAKAVVTNTGMQTKVGTIAGMIIENESPETPIQKKLGSVGKILGIACLVICGIIFIIGLIKRIDPFEMFMTSVGLAVAAIPEGLPAIVTIVLSIGVTKMAKKNSIVRKLPAVETLGSSNVICSDKTGTLTQNKMTVTQIESSNKYVASTLSCMCTDCTIKYENNHITSQGEATEVALVNNALKQNINKDELYQAFQRIGDIPFDSSRKLMTTIHKIPTGYIVITKGAPDILLNKCTDIINTTSQTLISDLKHRQITFNDKQNIQRQNNTMANNALRVIAVAYKYITSLPPIIKEEDFESNLSFVGLLGMIDPPRDGVREAVSTCKKAGIKTVMITGDHIATAKAIAKDLGILSSNDLAITGTELDSISDKELQSNIYKYSVFARVSPEHKVRIVKAWQSIGCVVAMTGDGVNDSPALKNADIGIAMGNCGTDVAKSAADMILTDDNFVTIVEAVKQGRNIYDNIQKAIHFLLSTNIGEIVTIFFGLILGMKSPLLAIQLLWINLITDSLPAIALGLEPAEHNIMNRKPVNQKQGLFSNGLWNSIIIEGFLIGVLTLVAFSIGNSMFGLATGRTMAFISIGLLELIHSFNVRSSESIFKVGLFSNIYLVGSFILGIFVQIIVVIIPSLANIFKLVPLTSIQWIITIGISILPIPIIELQKKLNEFKFGKIIYKDTNKVDYNRV